MKMHLQIIMVFDTHHDIWALYHDPRLDVCSHLYFCLYLCPCPCPYLYLCPNPYPLPYPCLYVDRRLSACYHRREENQYNVDLEVVLTAPARKEVCIPEDLE